MPKTKKVTPKKTNHSSAIFLALILSIALGVSVYAQSVIGTDSNRAEIGKNQLIPTRPEKIAPTKPAVDGACIATALETRDTSVGTALTIYSTAAQTALKTRTEAMKSAWTGDATARRTAIKTATENFTKAVRTARKTLLTAKQAAWKQFATDAKACAPAGSTISNGDTGTSVMDADL